MEFSEKPVDVFLPISVKLTNKKILVIGGGRIASHKINFLEQFTKNISVVALDVCDNIKSKSYSFIEKPYEKSDLEGAFLVYACTDIRELNQQIKNDAETLGILTNVVDDPGLCDFISPAIYKRGHITIAVGSNGQEVRRAIAVRNHIREDLESNDEIFYKTIN